MMCVCVCVCVTIMFMLDLTMGHPTRLTQSNRCIGWARVKIFDLLHWAWANILSRSSQKNMTKPNPIWKLYMKIRLYPNWPDLTMCGLSSSRLIRSGGRVELRQKEENNDFFTWAKIDKLNIYQHKYLIPIHKHSNFKIDDWYEYLYMESCRYYSRRVNQR